MLPSKSRLKTADFKQVKKIVKKTYFSKNFSLSVAVAGFEPSRFAVITSSSFSKKAVLRNKTKRRIKAVILKKINLFSDGLAVFIYPQKKVLDLAFKEIEKELFSLFEKAKIVKQ